MSMRATLPLIAAALALAACGANPDYFLLPPPQAAARAPSPAGSISVADISLPAYASALEIASLTGPGTVTLDKVSLWADTPPRALTRQLAAALGERLAARVGTDPWPGFDEPTLRVEVIVDRMIGARDGSLDFAGQYAIVAARDGRLTAFDRFAITVPPQGEGYPGLLAAHARAIDRLADRIAATITGRPPAS
jgi:uncharacterized lipoprotein YmbA